VKQNEEDIHLDWAEEVSTHKEGQAEEMELSTDNLSERREQEDLTWHRRPEPIRNLPPLTRVATTRTDRESLKQHADEYQELMNNQDRNGQKSSVRYRKIKSKRT